MTKKTKIKLTDEQIIEYLVQVIDDFVIHSNRDDLKANLKNLTSNINS